MSAGSSTCDLFNLGNCMRPSTLEASERLFAYDHPRRIPMRKFTFALATTAMLGLVAPAFAIETAAQTRSPVAQANVDANVKAKTNVHARAKVVHHRRGVNKLAQHDRGLHRGFSHSRHHGYAKTHHKSVSVKKTVA